jgi:hypothetical protein
MHPAAAAAGGASATTSIEPFELPVFCSVAGVEASLWQLSDHMGFSDEQLDDLTTALEKWREVEAEQQQQQNGGAGSGNAVHPLLQRLKNDYVQLRIWSARGRRDRMERALNTLLANALKV